MQLAEPWLGPTECRVLGSGEYFGTGSLGQSQATLQWQDLGLANH